MNYNKITVRDMCYFLNGRADKSHNEELFVNCSPEDFPDSEMYLFIQQKSNNFNVDLLDYLIFDIRTHPVQYALKINDDFVDLYDVDLSKSKLKLSSKPGEKLHETIERDLKSNNDLIIYSDQIIVFSKITEELYLKYSNKNTKQKEYISDKYNNEMPAEFKTDKAKEIFRRAIAARFIAESHDNYEWLGSRPQLAYFAELASEYLGTLKYKPYELLFGKNNLAQDAQKTRDVKGIVKNQKDIDNIFK